MKSPFKFGPVVSGDFFTNRTAEIKRLESNIYNDVHTVLISPRRWGKSSLVKQMEIKMENKRKKFRFCFIDLFKIRNEEDFYSSFANTIIKSTSSKSEEWIASAKMFLGKVTPRISFGTDPMSDFELSFDVRNIKKNYEEILNLPEKIAEEKNINVIVCIDEFQNLSNFNEPLLFQKRLRSVWQHHQRANYILYGSKRHMLMHIFEHKSMPFYKFGEVLYLDKIGQMDLISYIVSAFAGTGKTIDKLNAERIVEYVNCHSYYTQQLAHLVWLNTEETVNEEIVELAVNELVSQNAMLFQREVDGLSSTQIKLLKAVSQGVEKISSAEVIKRYKLSTSAHVTRAKKSLEKKELIDTLYNKIEFIDPVFLLWFERYFNR